MSSYQRTILPNGMHVFFFAMPYARSVTAQLTIQAGARFEPKESSGLAHFLEHVLFQKTSRYPTAAALEEAFDIFGGEVNAFTEKERVIFQAKFPKESCEKAIEFLYEIVFHPAIDEEGVRREKGIVGEELAEYADEPYRFRWEILSETMWPKENPLHRRTGGTVESIRQITKNQLISYLAKQYTPERSILVIVGNFEYDKIAKIIQLTLGKLAKGKSSQEQEKVLLDKSELTRQPDDISPVKRSIHGTQAHSLLATAVDIQYADHFFLALRILNEGIRRNIFNHFVYEKGWSYEASGAVWPFRDHTLFLLYGSGSREHAQEMLLYLQAIVKEIIIDDRFVKENKQRLLKGMFLNMADTDDFAEFISEQAFFGKDVIQTQETMEEAIKAITIDDVQKVRDLILKGRTRTLLLDPEK